LDHESFFVGLPTLQRQNVQRAQFVPVSAVWPPRANANAARRSAKKARPMSTHPYLQKHVFDLPQRCDRCNRASVSDRTHWSGSRYTEAGRRGVPRLAQAGPLATAMMGRLRWTGPSLPSAWDASVCPCRGEEDDRFGYSAGMVMSAARVYISRSRPSV
jgi:hypothetical protein